MIIEEMKEKRIMQLQLGGGKLAKVVTIRLDRKKIALCTSQQNLNAFQTRFH